jgi:5-methylcytosine-specific restriction endonuclease McrA
MILIVPSMKCGVETCMSRRKHRGYCPRHYQRLMRYGHPSKYKQTGAITNHRGYTKLRKPGHPLAGADGYVYAHRFHLYERIGPGFHLCIYCGKPVTWAESSPESHRALVVDHRNDDKSDNSPENLAPCCQSCNSIQFHARKRAKARADCA